ncbi:MAG TPA: cytochrome C [Epsilonproteobacteria bacterium]|nr:cytochrome C [Campylobacterota bacterium]HHH37490.1 cytochrome C [Campylobacterota bacterium]
MTKILAGFFLTGALLSAGPYTKQDRIKDMQTMASAMQEIQTGFFYNNFDMIKEGTAKLSDTIVKIQPPLEEVEEKDVMTRYVNRKVQMSNKIKKKVNRKAKDLIERFKEGDAVEALQAYTKITKYCMECHTQLRNW